MKVAISIVGHLRNFEYCANNEFFKKLITNNDVFVTTYDTIHPISSCNTGYLNDKTPTCIDDIKRVYNTDMIQILETTDFSNESYRHFESNNFGRVSDFKSQFNLLKNNIKQVKACDDYDLIVRTRPDLYLLSEIDLTTNKFIFPATTYFPDFKRKSVTDMFYKGTPDDIQDYANFFDHIDSYVDSNNFQLNNWHERFINYYLRDYNILDRIHIDDTIRFQLYRQNPKQFTVGFFDKNGKLLEIPQI
jgi:hypothetical protein